MTDTGSVAAIRTPNNAAPIQLQPTSQCMPAATTAAAMATPANASARVSGSSSRKRRHSSWSAASNTSGGRRTLKMSSRDSGSVGTLGSSAIKAGDNQPDDVGQPQPARQHRDQAGDQQQDADRSKGNAGHERGITSQVTAVCRKPPCRMLVAALYATRLRGGERNASISDRVGNGSGVGRRRLPGSNSPDNGNAGATAQAATGHPSSTISSKRASRRIPAFAVGQGRHEYDGQIADLSAAGITARSID